MPSGNDPKVFVRAPVAPLRGYVKRLLVIEFGQAVDDAHLPDTGVFMAFPFRGECHLENGSVVPRAALTGLCSRLRRHAHSRDNAVVVVAFTPTGASALVPGSLDEFANTTVALDDVMGDATELARLHVRLAEATDHACRLRLVEQYLISRLRFEAGDPLVAAAVDWLQRAAGTVRIEDLVRHIGLSQSALERRFRRVVGTSPKRFASLLRLNTIVRLHAAGETLTSIAHAAGYFDQSHFIHDFKRVTGVAPEAYFSSGARG